MSEAVEPRQSYAPAEPGLIDEVERRILVIGGKEREGTKGGSVEGLPVKHTFTPGLYVREITMPAGFVLTSKIHKTEHPYVVSKGSCSVLIEGTGFVHIEAPCMGVTQPGTRRLLIIHKETIWTTFHPTMETDLVALEDLLLVEYENPLLDTVSDWQDYLGFLEEIGLSETAIRQLTEQSGDLIEELDIRLELRPSVIHGFGVFAKEHIAVGSELVANTGSHRTLLGRYANHSAKPTCTPSMEDDAMVFVPNMDLEPGAELTVNYRSTRGLSLEVTQ